MSKGNCKQWVVSDESQVPAGFKQLKEWGPPRTQGKAGSVEYETLHRAYRNATIEAYKVMQSPRDKCGPVFVNAAQAQVILSSELYRGQPVQQSAGKCAQERGVDSQHAESLCESLASIDSTLDKMCRVLERLAEAAESIATQPKTAQQELLATMSSNGFHN